jgi:hypothetical protein
MELHRLRNGATLLVPAIYTRAATLLHRISLELHDLSTRLHHDPIDDGTCTGRFGVRESAKQGSPGAGTADQELPYYLIFQDAGGIST